MSIDLFIQNAKVHQDEAGDFIAEIIYRGLELCGVGITRQQALQHLREFLVVADEEHELGHLA